MPKVQYKLLKFLTIQEAEDEINALEILGWVPINISYESSRQSELVVVILRK